MIYYVVCYYLLDMCIYRLVYGIIKIKVIVLLINYKNFYLFVIGGIYNLCKLFFVFIGLKLVIILVLYGVFEVMNLYVWI